MSEEEISLEKSNKKKNLTTSQLLAIIKKSGQFSDVTNIFQEQTELPGFCHYLYEIMDKHNMTAKDVIRKSGIERSYYYHILSGQKTPGRNILLRICFCISATLSETNQLLRLANHNPLYAKVHRDAALIFAIDKKYTMQEANTLLIQAGEQPLYQEEPV